MKETKFYAKYYILLALEHQLWIVFQFQYVVYKFQYIPILVAIHCSYPIFIIIWYLMLAACLTTNNPSEPALVNPITKKIGALPWISFFLGKVDVSWGRIDQKYQSLSETHIIANTLPKCVSLQYGCGGKNPQVINLTFLVGKMVNK